MKKYLLIVLFLILSGASKLFAATIKVSSIAALQAAISEAKPGDVILVTDGVYVTTADIIINKAGTSDQPITIAAENPVAAEISGSGGIDLVSPAAYIIIRGFKLTHAASKARSGPGTSFCRWEHNIFETPGVGEYLTIAGNDHEISYNTFQNKNSMGRILAIRGSGKQIAERLWIHHNYFYNFPDQGGKNGAETLQFGLSGFSLSSSNSIVEFNLFEKCAGENELISVKASAVIIRYNTIRDCPAQFTLRHGNFNQVYGNYFFDTPGLRIFGDDQLIFSNYFENCSVGINIGNGDGEVADGAQLTAHDRPDRALIVCNTLVNNKNNFTQSGRKNGMGARFITVAYNIIQGGGPAASISGPYENGVWEGNIIYKTEAAGDMPKGGYIMEDPKLVHDASGLFYLQRGSPAIDAVKGKYEKVTVDMDGQPRKGKPDAGADEFSADEIKAGMLTVEEVGYAAGSGNVRRKT